MDKFRIYLAGACKGLPDEGKRWRKSAKSFFKGISKFSDKEIIVYDPTEYFSRDGRNSINDKQVKNFYLKHLIKNCNLVLVNLEDTIVSVGTGMELQYAMDKEISIVGFNNVNSYEWFPDCCDVIFEDIKSAREYICEYYL